MGALNSDIGLYIHIPFCVRKCGYCDFATYPYRPEMVDGLIAAIETEARRSASDAPGPVRTVFIGGGTPSLLTGRQMTRLLRSLRKTYSIDPEAEVTVEANPETADAERLKKYRAAGVNRLSIGAQTFDDDALRLLGRTHAASDTIKAVRAARAAGFDNLSLDLMFGLPGQTLRQWQNDVQKALALEPTHLSAYNLTIEPKTLFNHWQKRGQLQLPEDDLQADMYEWTLDAMERAGYPYYELSNYAAPGWECRHNLRYWRNEPHAALGPGAAAYLNGTRSVNTRGTRSYLKRIAEGRIAAVESERLTGLAERAETIRQALRMRSGLRLTDYESRFGSDVRVDFQSELDQLTRLGLTELLDGALRLTRRGALLANEAFLRLLPESGVS